MTTDSKRIEQINNELKLLKNEIKQVLLGIQEHVLSAQNPFTLVSLQQERAAREGAAAAAAGPAAVVEEAVAPTPQAAPQAQPMAAEPQPQPTAHTVVEGGQPSAAEAMAHARAEGPAVHHEEFSAPGDDDFVVAGQDDDQGRDETLEPPEEHPLTYTPSPRRRRRARARAAAEAEDRRQEAEEFEDLLEELGLTKEQRQRLEDLAEGREDRRRRPEKGEAAEAEEGMTDEERAGAEGEGRAEERLDLTTVLGLAMWADRVMRKVGRQNMEALLDISEMTGRLSNQRRAVLQRFVDLMAAGNNGFRVSPKETVSFLAQLEGILGLGPKEELRWLSILLQDDDAVEVLPSTRP